jgi:hypothetical protein
MLAEAALELLVERQLNRESEQGRSWFETCRHRYAAASHADAVRAYSEEVFHPLIRLSQQVFDIYWEPHLSYVAMPSPTVSAYAERIGPHRVVVVHQGLLDLLRLWAIRSVLIDALMNSALPNREREQAAKAAVACCHGLSLALCDRPIRIPNYHLRLSGEAKLNTLQIYVGALSFVLAHEISHHRLGHTEAVLDLAALRAKTGPHLLIDEHLVFTKRREFEADRAALFCARAERTPFLAAAQMFLENLAMIQTVHGNRFGSHPLAANRLGALRAGLPTDTIENIAALFARADEFAEQFLALEKLGRDEVVAGFRINVPKAIETLDTIVTDLFGTGFKDDFVRSLLRDQAEDIADERQRREVQSHVASMTAAELHGSAAATVVSITENYLNLLSLGRTPAEALAEIDAFRARMNGGRVEVRDSLHAYARARLQLDHRGYSLSEDRLAEFIGRTHSFHSW